MNIFGRIILGALLIVGGILLLKNNYRVSNSLPLSFAERYIGSGGSYTAWLILSVLVVLVGLIIVFGLGDNLLNIVLSPLTKVFNQGQ